MRSEPPEAAEVATGEQARALRANLERLGFAFDAIAEARWTAPLTAEQRRAVAERWAPGPATLLQMLGYARDEEAFVFGRRVMRVLQEHEPILEHLTYELGDEHTRYDDGTAALHFAELVKSRIVYLDLLANAGPMAPFERGLLPPEEGDGSVTLEQILAAALRRDRALWQLVREIKSA